jgi:type II secretory ATPase GspE/PulE/Tfp pilus assembly ATPase PilB-like protein
MESATLDDFQNVIAVNIESVFKKERISKKIIDSVKLLKNSDDDKLVLKVINDVGSDTEFYDFQKQLNMNGYNFKTEFCDRKTIEHLHNIFADQHKHVESEVGDDDKSVQPKVIEIIKNAVDKRASDIHIEVNNQSAYVKFRIDGKLTPNRDYPADEGKRIINALYNSMCEERSSSTLSYTEPTDAKIREEFVQNLGLSTGRFASRPGGGGKIKVVIRLIKRRRVRMALGELGLTPQQSQIIVRNLNKPSGVIFSSGPTGHGKSTLSQCMAELVTSADDGLNVITIEDPIESPIEGAFQTPLIIADRGNRELLSKAWGSAITNVMRMDPDWIYIGEVRDRTSAMGAVEAAQTGHNVITTIHTQYPIDIISRLKNLEVDYDLITDATLITCLIGLRLVPLLCPSCKKSYSQIRNKVSQVFQRAIEENTQTGKVYLRNASGCSKCNHTGRKGRIGVFEVIETNADFMHLYHTKGKIEAYTEWYRNGGITICDNVLRLVNEGVIDPIDSHKDICNLDRDVLMFTEQVRKEAEINRKTGA